ncbi:hypothetical protein BJX76DRAFT_359949 [Aspergillus varians]
MSKQTTDPGQPRRPGPETRRPPTSIDRTKSRTQLLRRHGLTVTDEHPNVITIFIDIPAGTSPYPIETTNSILNAVKQLIYEVDSRILTKEFCNPHNAPGPSYSRVMITAYTDQETPFTVYTAVFEALVSLLDSLAERDARGEILEIDEKWMIEEGCIVIQWVRSGVPLERYFNNPVVDLQ